MQTYCNIVMSLCDICLLKFDHWRRQIELFIDQYLFFRNVIVIGVLPIVAFCQTCYQNCSSLIILKAFIKMVVVKLVYI